MFVFSNNDKTIYISAHVLSTLEIFTIISWFSFLYGDSKMFADCVSKIITDQLYVLILNC